MKLDKRSEKDGGSKYVYNGMYLKVPARFINYSCDRNCLIYTVSYSPVDVNIYDLAFFATEPTAAGMELTFNYMDINKTDIITEAVVDKLESQRFSSCRVSTWSSRCRDYSRHILLVADPLISLALSE